MALFISIFTTMFWEKYKKILLINYSSIIIVVISISALAVYYTISTSIHVSNKSSVVEIYFADNISIAHKAVIEGFNKKYRDEIKVIPIDLPFTKFSTNERKELLTRALRSKSKRIDVFAVDLIWVHRFAKWSEQLDKYFPDVKSDGFLDHALKSCIVNDKLVAVPLYIDISLMFYRDDLLRTLPNYNQLIEKLKKSITWEELIALSKYFEQNKNPLYMFPAKDYEGLICSYYELILNQDRNFFNGEGFDLTSKVAVNSLQFLVDLVNKYKISPPIITQFKENDCYQNFINQNGVFVRGWPSFDRNIKIDSSGNTISQHIKLAALPHMKGFEKGSIFGGWNLMMAKFSDHKAEVVKFIEYATSDEAQEIMFAKSSFLPVRTSFYAKSEYLSKYPDFAYLKELMDNGIHRPYFDDYTRISDIISYYVNKALQNEISVDSALSEANELIEENKVIIK